MARRVQSTSARQGAPHARRPNAVKSSRSAGGDACIQRVASHLCGGDGEVVERDTPKPRCSAPHRFQKPLDAGDHPVAWLDLCRYSCCVQPYQEQEG